MEQVLEKIWSYGSLSDRERADVEKFVSVNEEYAPLLEDSKRLHALFEQAGVFASDSSDTIALAYLVAHDQLASGVAPGILEKAYERLYNKIETMPHALDRYTKVRERMEEVAESSDPISQFELLSGFSVDLDYSESEDRRRPRENRFVKDRPSVKRRSMRSLVPFRARASLVLIGCMLVFYISYSTNRIARNAFTSSDVLLIDVIVEKRGVDDYAKPVSPDVVFTFAQRALYESQKVWFGIYYSFDQQKLKEAEELLLRVRNNPSSSSFLLEESTYLLAKVYLAQKSYSEAAILLDELITMRSRRLEEALQLRSLL